jgi:hypothetical protein
MEPRTALTAYQASCLINAKRIKQFLAGRKGFCLTYGKEEVLDNMVGVLMDQIDGMEDTWEDILAVVRRRLIDTPKDALLGEWSWLMVSTRKIVDEGLGVSGQFHIIFPGDKDPDLNETDELYFSAGEHEDLGSLATIWSQERTKPTPTKPANGQKQSLPCSVHPQSL